jgi:hypothetical protein
VIYPARKNVPSHERAVHQALATRIAALHGRQFGGVHDGAAVSADTYYIPTGTIVGVDMARGIGIETEDDLFGAVVPHAFIATKAISHPLVRGDAAAPEGWSKAFSDAVRDATLRGLTAFTMDDAREAGRRLLDAGPIRVKPVLATGGRGQTVVQSADELDAALQDLASDELTSCGVVLEENLDQVVTYSVGQVRVAGLVASYWGTQRLTPDNAGEAVYGGSDLCVVRGGFDALLAFELDSPVRKAVEQGRIFDDAASLHYAGLLASRRNYDIAQGIDPQGQVRSGVLEQSWRIGGASGAEVVALESFAADPALNVVRASTVELYGPAQHAPEGACVTFRGVDEDVGFITKFVMAGRYGNT